MEVLLIVASPLQCINAIEAARYLNAKSLEIVMLIDGNVKNKQQMEDVFNYLNIVAPVTVIDVPKNQKLLPRLVFLLKLRHKINIDQKFKYVIIGHFRSIFQAATANLYNCPQIFVDDGTRTIEDARFLKGNGYRTVEFRLKRFVYTLFSVDIFPRQDDYTFFTYYAEKISIENGGRIIKNNFNVLKNKMLASRVEQNQKIVFIGQSLVDTNLLSQEDYLSLLKGIDGYYTSEFGDQKQVEYYAHRNESEEIERLIENQLGWKITRNKLPLELHFISTGQLPKEIGFFFTSAAETLSFIFEKNLKLNSFYIKRDMLFGRQSEIEKLYALNRESPRVHLVENYTK